MNPKLWLNQNLCVSAWFKRNFVLLDMNQNSCLGYVWVAVPKVLVNLAVVADLHAHLPLAVGLEHCLNSQRWGLATLCPEEVSFEKLSLKKDFNLWLKTIQSSVFSLKLYVNLEINHEAIKICRTLDTEYSCLDSTADRVPQKIACVSEHSVESYTTPGVWIFLVNSLLVGRAPKARRNLWYFMLRSPVGAIDRAIRLDVGVRPWSCPCVRGREVSPSNFHDVDILLDLRPWSCPCVRGREVSPSNFHDVDILRPWVSPCSTSDQSKYLPWIKKTEVDT